VCRAPSSHRSHRGLNFPDRRGTPSKPSKSATKKAAKAAARQEKKLQNQVPPSGGDTYERLSAAPAVPLTDTENRLSAPSDESPIEPRIEPPEPLPLNPPRDEVPSSVLNGYSTNPGEGFPRPAPPEVPPSLPYIPQRARPTTVDLPSAQSLPSSPPAKQAPPPSDSIPSSSNNVNRPASSTTSLISGTDAEPEKAAKKGHNVLVRTLWTFIMLGGFLGQLYTLYRATRGANAHRFRLPTHGSCLHYHSCISLPDSCVS
jgi:phosphatidate cytidylyltransferase